MNKETIIQEIMDWFDKEYPGVHNEVRHSKCARDTGYNYDAIVSDLETGGIAKTIEVAGRYWSGASSHLPSGEVEYAVAVNKKLGEVLSQSVPEEQVGRVGRLINNINDIVTTGKPQGDWEDIMLRRHNTQFYSDKVPDKKIIENILQRAHSLTPHKNNFYRYRINVFGPEHAEEKRMVGISSVGGEGKDKYRKDPTPENIKELTEIYDKWTGTENRMKGYPKVDGCNFNTQVLAPYLLAYTHEPDFKSESQKESAYQKSGQLDKIFNQKTSNYNAMDWVIQASMHGISTSYLSAEKGLTASFCRCFFSDELLDNKILGKHPKVKDQVAFLVGIGYADTEPRHKSYVAEPTYDEIVTWK